MSSRDPEILIVGAGPTGLTAALELARRDVPICIVDSKDGPTPLSKAVGISSHSLDILGGSRVAPRLVGSGIKIRHAHFSFEGRELGRFDFAALPHRHDFLLSLPQASTETIMAEVLATFGVTIRWRTALQGLVEQGDKVRATFATSEGDEEENVFDYVFGADGVGSTVRKAMGIDFPGYTHKRIWSIADAEIRNWPYEPDSAQAFLHRDGSVGFIIPIGTHRFRAISNTAAALTCVPGSYRVVKVSQSDQFRLPVRQASRYQVGRVFLGGDAAHVHSPIGARGMNLGIEDVACFARRFDDDQLGGYAAEREPVGRRWIKLSERILSMAQADTRLIQFTRNVALSVMGHSPWLQRPLLERIAGLKE